MNGSEFCQWIKTNTDYCHLPVIMLTAKAGMKDQIAGIENGAEAYIMKPFEPEYLKAVIENLLENRKRLQSILRKGINPDNGDGSYDTQLNERDRKFLEMLYLYLDKNLSNAEVNINMLCRELGFSRASFYLKIKALTDLSPLDFLHHYKLNKAAEMIKSGTHNLSEISYITGFTSLSTFSRAFKNEFGVSPSKYGKEGPSNK